MTRPTKATVPADLFPPSGDHWAQPGETFDIVGWRWDHAFEISVTDDNGTFTRCCLVRRCHHLGGKDWILS